MTLRPQRGHYYAEVMLNYSAPSIASKYIKAGGYAALQVFFRSKRYVKQVFSSGVYLYRNSLTCASGLIG